MDITETMFLLQTTFILTITLLLHMLTNFKRNSYDHLHSCWHILHV